MFRCSEWLRVSFFVSDDRNCQPHSSQSLPSTKSVRHSTLLISSRRTPAVRLLLRPPGWSAVPFPPLYPHTRAPLPFSPTLFAETQREGSDEGLGWLFRIAAVRYPLDCTAVLPLAPFYMDLIYSWAIRPTDTELPLVRRRLFPSCLPHSTPFLKGRPPAPDVSRHCLAAKRTLLPPSSR